MINTVELLRIRRDKGVKAAKEYALNLGYKVRWDAKGDLYIRDLLEVY